MQNRLVIQINSFDKGNDLGAKGVEVEIKKLPHELSL